MDLANEDPPTIYALNCAQHTEDRTVTFVTK